MNEITIGVFVLIIIILLFNQEKDRRSWNRLSERYYERGVYLRQAESDIRGLVEGDFATQTRVRVKYKIQYDLERVNWMGEIKLDDNTSDNSFESLI